HVAVVEQVYKNGSIKVSEYNFYRPLKYNTRVLSKKAARNFNYVY
ncbi:CHAP domain-containing protein, partial [Staphylococcus sp. EG-SA-2]|nr:CHAP domain-containing protein [Staphylococcus sp. EG-SA-2]